jgi:DNA-binding LytR/AlgR family response regulator
MKVLIVEDEPIASERLAEQITSCHPQAEIAHIFDTVEDTVDYFKSGQTVDLAFFDIQLSDGTSFDIFKQVEINNPIIFTTAYDQYTLQAFKVNSIDYLLKPIDHLELKQAFQQFEKHHHRRLTENQMVDKLLRRLMPSYKQRLLMKLGDHYYSKTVEEIAFFYAEGKVTYTHLRDNHKRYIIDYTLENLESQMLDPRRFFRINRKFIINIEAITEIKSYVNGRLRLVTSPASAVDMIVSRERVSDFKDWLNQ